MIIGFFGIQCGSSNKGVSALAYSVLNLFNNMLNDKTKFILFTADSSHDILTLKNSLGINHKNIVSISHSNRSIASIHNLAKQIKICDCIIDFTGGDSFSDIYGARRILSSLFNKQMILNCKVPLILAPQTYGPFNNKIIKQWVKHVINKAEIIFLRDEESKIILKKITDKQLYTCTDVAFSLPWINNKYPMPENGKIKIGINISGLLWNGGYSQDNQFNLKTDYQLFSKRIIAYMVESNLYDIYLIPHVISNRKNSLEDDVVACEKIKELFPQCKLSPIFETPIQVKSFISQLDVFIGARMHSTIAAFSTNIPTIPIAYSKKFSGLYRNLGYDVIVNLSEMKIEESIQKTISYIENIDDLKSQIIQSNELAQKKLDIFVNQMNDYLINLQNLKNQGINN